MGDSPSSITPPGHSSVVASTPCRCWWTRTNRSEASTATTTTAAAGASEDDPTLLALTSASGFAAGRVYRLSGGGLYEDIEILGISGANATVRNPLINDYASGATLTAMRATVAVGEAQPVG